MSRKHSLSAHFQPFFVAAVLAAYFNSREEGFRQKEVRFMVELFSNWMEATIGDTSLSLQNVQISRFLDQLRDQLWLTITRRDRVPRYLVTRRGLERLLAELVTADRFLPLEQVFFVYYFLKSYGGLFERLVRDEEGGASRALKRDLEAIRNPRLVVEAQIRFLDKEIERLQSRINEARDAAQVAEGILSSGGGMDKVVGEIQRRFPYELNSRKPLKELIAGVPVSLRQWEMTEGLRHRAAHLWIPLKTFLEHNRAVLASLEAG